MRRAEEFRFLILATQREGNRALAQALRTLGLTPAQAEALRILDDYGTLSLRGVGELLVCESGHSPSRIIDRLVSMGTVAKTVATTDRRETTLTLTRRGLALAAKVADIEAAIYGAIEGAVSDRDMAVVIRVLRSLVGELPAGQAIARRKTLSIT